ncbi:hypothetical protein JOY44_25730 (plasmid) [Phormidium sp. CLA17]|nr:hypothetical protein [Leptolyngbya sp. Cla-17]MBM0744923.1 hypothetical protein [Leptolyngbya sp. Cla-17]
MTEFMNGVMITTGVLAIALHVFALIRQKRNRRPIHYLPPTRSQEWFEQ